MNGLCRCGCGQPAPLARKTNRARGAIRGKPQRFIAGHGRRSSPIAFKVDPATGCWEWQRYRDRNGYGRTFDRATKTTVLAHRSFYELAKGPIPDGLQLDHLCRNPACVNPNHLEPVTNATNSRRGMKTKLTFAQVQQIRASNEPPSVVASHFGIHPAYVGQLRRYEQRVAA